MIRGACAEAATWSEPLRIAVNVSAAQLNGSGLAQTVIGALAATGLAPDRLELELTESVFLGDDAAKDAAVAFVGAPAIIWFALSFRELQAWLPLLQPRALRAG